MAKPMKGRKARFVAVGFTAEQMAEFGQSLAADVKERIQSAQNVYDEQADGLRKSYAKYKRDLVLQPVRDWIGPEKFTLSKLAVLSSTKRRSVIGFSDPMAAARAAFNNRRERQFGMSPRNKAHIARVISRVATVRVRGEAA